MRCSNACGTSGVSRSAASGTPNSHHQHDRNRGRERPADDGRDAASAGQILIERGAAAIKLGGQRRIADFQPRQQRRGQAASARSVPAGLSARRMSA